MAKKKHKKKSPRRRSRSVGGIGKSEMTMAAGVAAGVIGTRIVQNFATKQFPTWNAKAVAAVPAGLGAAVILNPIKALSFLNTPFFKGVGYGLLGGGLSNLATEFKILGAAGSPFFLKRRVAGSGNMNVLAGSQKGFLSGGNPNMIPQVAGGGNRRSRYMGTCG
jgi:hypothetical protein